MDNDDNPPPYSSLDVHQPSESELTKPDQEQPLLAIVQQQATVPIVSEMNAIEGQKQTNRTTEHKEMSDYNNPHYAPNEMLRAPVPARRVATAAVNSPSGTTMFGARQPNAFMIRNSMLTQGAHAAMLVRAAQTEVEGQQNVRSRGCTGALIFSCLVMWMCNLPIGLSAYFLAVKANNTSDRRAASRYDCHSYALSITGILVSIIVIIVVVFTAGIRHSSFNLLNSCVHHVPTYGCYAEKTCDFTSSRSCLGVYYSGCCYTN